MQKGAARFDQQAGTFDARKGLPAEVAAAVARAVLDVSEARPDDMVVEVGAGTGEIGRHLVPCVRYLGIDASAGMLDIFRARSPQARLVRADADEGWPVPSGEAVAVFASRAAHLLDAAHLVAEVRRVCRPGGAFLVGRVQRDPDSVKSRLRREKRRLLGEGESGEERTRRLLDRFVAEGATAIDRRVVATWTTTASAAEVLAGWAAEPELRRWAGDEFGDLDRVVESTEQYTLAGVILPEGPWTTRS